MAELEAQDPRVLAHYEGLVCRTAQLVALSAEDEVDELQQQLRIKVWRILIAYRGPDDCMLVPSCRCKRCRFVFSCLTNKVKDLKRNGANRRKRGELYIEDVAPVNHHTRVSFEARYLRTDTEQVFGIVEEGDLLIPCTLDDGERRVLVGLYSGRTQAEIAGEFGFSTYKVAELTRSLREKLADWKPTIEAAGRPSPAPQAQTAIAA